MKNTRKVHQIYVIFVYIRTFLAFLAQKNTCLQRKNCKMGGEQ
jgi:hypothetical protein